MIRQTAEQRKAYGESPVNSAPIEKVGLDHPYLAPYIAGRREWDARYGDLITRARHWRQIAFLIGAGCVIVSMALVVSLRSARVVPYVVQVDAIGRAVAAGPAEHTVQVDDRIKRAALARWIEELRSVTTDGIAMRMAIDHVYAFIANGSPASVEVSEYYRSDPPTTRAASQTVEARIVAVFPTTERTYEIEWEETVRNLIGEIQSRDHWKGSVTLTVNPPSDEATVRVNPLGIYVMQISWSKVL